MQDKCTKFVTTTAFIGSIKTADRGTSTGFRVEAETYQWNEMHYQGNAYGYVLIKGVVMVKRLLYLALLLGFLMLLPVGCGGFEGEGDLQEEDNLYYADDEEHRALDFIWAELLGEEDLFDDGSLGYLPSYYESGNIVTITVRGDRRYERMLQQARDEINAEWVIEGRDYTLHINFDSYTIDNWFEANQRLRVELMAGQGPDLMLVSGTPIWNWVRSGFFVDIYQLIDQEPHMEREDFFTNVLEALEYEGRLYVFPLSFGFEYVAINANLPQSFIDRFMQYNFISMGDLLSIYVDLMDEYDHIFGHMYPGNGSILASASQAIFYGMAPFVDFNTGIATLTDNRFIEFLNMIQRVYTPMDLFQSFIYGSVPIANQEAMEEFSNQFTFFVEFIELGPINAFFTPTSPYFLHYIPIVCEQGRLRVNHTLGGPTWQHVSLPKAGNSELAWEFTQHLLNAMAYPDLVSQAIFHSIGSYSFATPIRRDMFEPRMRNIMMSTLVSYAQPFVGMDDEVNRIHLVDNAIERLAYLNEMPITAPPFIQRYDIDHDVLEQLLAGVITAEDAAQSLQNQITLRLME